MALATEDSVNVAALATSIGYAIKGLDELKRTMAAIDVKLDAMHTDYVSGKTFDQWKTEEYHPFKAETRSQFQLQSDRQARLSGILVGAIITGLMSLAVYLIVAHVKP